jgi:hypothetical protein
MADLLQHLSLDNSIHSDTTFFECIKIAFNRRLNPRAEGVFRGVAVGYRYTGGVVPLLCLP